jgi:DNA-binding beta-propeller fold protein YncE
MQCFERRCLTYTPGNPPGFVTEAGNVGLHYYAWRYQSQGTPTPTASATATEEPLPEFRVYVTDLLQHRVQVFTLQGEYLFAFGRLGSGDGEFESPSGVAVDQVNGWVYIADSGNDRIERFDLDGNYLSQFGGTGNTPGTFDHPLGIAVDNGGFVYVADTGNNRIQKLNSTGGVALQWGGVGDLPGQFNSPVAVSVSSTNVAFVVDNQNHRVQAFDATSGQYLRLWGGFGTGPTNYQSPSGVALDGINEGVFVTSTQQDHVLHTDQAGNFVFQFGRSGDASDVFGFNQPTGIAIDPNIVSEDERVYNVVYVVDSENDRVMIYTSDVGVPLGQIGESGADPGQFTQPAGVAVYHPLVAPVN